jgi:hypothetical protein
MHRRLRRPLTYALLAVLLGIVAVVVLLTLDDRARTRLTEETGVVQTAKKVVRRFRVRVTEKTSRTFRQAARATPRNELPNEFGISPTPVDPDAAPVSSSDVAPVSAAPRGAHENAPEDLTIFAQTVVDNASSDTSHVAEPAVATDGIRALLVWNWGAARSLDGGRTFERLDPEPSALEFCCDQLAYYDPGRDLWIWLLQYGGPNGDDEKNVIRLAYASGQGFAQRPRPLFSTFDLSAHDIAGKRGEDRSVVDGDSFLDFSRMAATKEHLYVSVNIFPTKGNAYEGSLVVRIPLDQLVTRNPRPQWYLSGARTTGLTSGATDTMYLASHETTSKLRVCRWEDLAENPSCGTVSHTSESDPHVGSYSCRREGAPATSDWCQQIDNGVPEQDDRPLSGWVADGLVGFSWNAKQDAAHGFPFPFTMVVRLDEQTLKVVDEPHIWQPDRAYQYAAIRANARGDLGAVALVGGGKQYETCVALLRDKDAAKDKGWHVVAVDASDSDSQRAKSGDYLGIAPSAPGSDTWVGSCMTLHGGGSAGDIDIRFVSFGRAADAR